MFQDVADCCETIDEKAFKLLLCAVQTLLSLLLFVCIPTAEILLAKPFLQCFRQHFPGGLSWDLSWRNLRHAPRRALAGKPLETNPCV